MSDAPAQLVRSSDLPWRPLAETGVSGVAVKVLRRDPAADRAPTILLKFDPGASYPVHRHPGGEELFVLEGDLDVGGRSLGPGDYLFTPPGGVHGVRSRGGCVLLAVVPQEVQRLGLG